MEEQELRTEVEWFDISKKAAERLNKPWQYALVATNLFWAIVLSIFVCLVYLNPVDVEQKQNFPDNTQEQVVKGVR